MPEPPPGRRPLVVAHRAANDLAALRRAEAAEVDMVEADLWLHGGRLEVRHSKTMGPVPLLWDRWLLAPGWTRRLLLEDVLPALSPGMGLMLDLKRLTPALPDRLMDAMRALAPERPYTVSSQSWAMLDAFEADPCANVVHSVGSERMLRDLPRWLESGDASAIAIHQRLLTAERAGALLELAPRLFAWAVNDRARLDELVSWGVNGVITDVYTLLPPPAERPAV